MRRLILIKHSKPRIDPQLPARDWKLSPEGRELCAPLADALAPHQPEVLVTSDEPKAAETGQLVGAILKLPSIAAPNLHEHDRANVPYMRPADFISSVANFFSQPQKLVLGRETPAQAAARFNRAVDDVLSAHPHPCLAIVTHGTVISLLAQARAGLEPFPLWRRLGLPSFMIFELPTWRVLNILERIAGE